MTLQKISEIADVTIPTETPVSEMSDEEVIKMHFEAWHQREVVDVFGVSDLQHEKVALQELENRGWEASPADELYVRY
jgi:hypothetical protein